MVKGEGEIAGLTDVEKPRRLGPKRAAHIRTAFVLRKTDDVRKYVVTRSFNRKDSKHGAEKTFYKSPKVQRLVTEKRVRRKVLNKRNRVDAWKKNKEAHVAYEKLLSKYLKEKKAAKKAADPTPVVPEKTEKKAAPAKAPAKVEKKAAPPKREVEAAPPKKEEKKGGKKGGKK